MIKRTILLALLITTPTLAESLGGTARWTPPDLLTAPVAYTIQAGAVSPTSMTAVVFVQGAGPGERTLVLRLSDARPPSAFAHGELRQVAQCVVRVPCAVSVGSTFSCVPNAVAFPPGRPLLLEAASIIGGACSGTDPVLNVQANY